MLDNLKVEKEQHELVLVEKQRTELELEHQIIRAKENEKNLSGKLNDCLEELQKFHRSKIESYEKYEQAVNRIEVLEKASFQATIFFFFGWFHYSLFFRKFCFRH